VIFGWSIRILILLVFLVGLCGSGEAALESGSEPLRFAEQAGRCKAWYPSKIDSLDKVVTGRAWWRGRSDSSLALGLGFTTEALVLEGEFLDNLPFQQGTAQPYRPAYWQLEYIGDGLEVLLEDPAQPGRRLRFFLNWGTGALDPRVEVLERYTTGTPSGAFLAPPERWPLVPGMPQPQLCPHADLILFDGVVPEDGDEPTVRFQAAIPYESLFSEPRVGPQPAWRVTIRLYDLDSDPRRMKILEDTILTPAE
jgi:hypothetical protein